MTDDDDRDRQAERARRKNLEWDVGSWSCALAFLLVAGGFVALIVAMALTLPEGW